MDGVQIRVIFALLAFLPMFVIASPGKTFSWDANNDMNPTQEDQTVEIVSLLEESYKSRVNNLAQSISLAEKALTLSRSLHVRSLEGRSLNQLSLYYMIMGAYDQSTERAKEAISIFETLNDEQGIADAKYNIAGVYYKTDNYHLGLAYLIDCLGIFERHKDYHNVSRTEKSLGTIYEYFGDPNNAAKSYENAIAAGQKTGDQNLESNVYNNLSGLYLKQDRIAEAKDLINRSVAIKKQTGDTRGLAFAIYGRGKVNAKEHKYAEAEEDYREAMRIHTEMGEKLGLGMAYHKLGALFVETGRLEEAKAVAEEGIEFSNKHNAVIIKFKCHYLLYRIYKIENDHESALKYLEQYFKEKEAVINTQTLKVIENYELIMQMKTLEKEAELQREKAEIIEKKNRAEEAARVRQEFLSTMSHEIRTPLNAVTTIVSLLSDKSDPEEKQLLDSLKFASNNLLRIINDILDFTKLDAGKTTLEARPAPIKPLLENILHTYENLAWDKGLKLSLKMDVGIAEHYELDETKMTQILSNLISNAIKFTDVGKVDIEVEKVSDDRSHDLVLFKVSDTGEGIAPHYLVEIFDSFSQTKPITTRKQGGTGLGLAIVKKLVELHGGDINVQSEEGKGSVFHFSVPLKKHIQIAKTQANIPQGLQGKTALLAEDNEINAMVASKLLSKWGVSTQLAVNGREAVEMSNAKAFDFILMDIHMPEMNGFDATALIRTHENPNTSTPIFALTADITASSKEDYRDYFNGFLWKPLQVEKLFEALMNATVF